MEKYVCLVLLNHYGWLWITRTNANNTQHLCDWLITINLYFSIDIFSYIFDDESLKLLDRHSFHNLPKASHM